MLFGLLMNCMVCVSNILLILVFTMIAACFCGWNVTLTKKTIWRVIECVIFYSLTSGYIYNFLAFTLFPDLYDAVSHGNLEENMYFSYRVACSCLTQITRVWYSIVFFIVFLFIYQEKKISRALWTTIISCIFTRYIMYIFTYAYVLFRGGKWETMQQINYYMGEEYTNSSVFCNIASFIVMVALTTILYFGYYRKKCKDF